MLSSELVRRWLSRGFWALADRGLFSVSNFVLNILLARWLTAEGYGAFAVAFTLFLLLGAVHSGMLTEPMLVFGPGKHRDRFREYLGVLLVGHVVVAVGGALLIGGAALVLQLLGGSAAAAALLAVAVSSPFILLQWLARMACYVGLNPRPAAGAGLAYLLLVVAGTVGLHRSGDLGGASALILMGAASLVSVAWLLLRLGPVRPRGAEGAAFSREVMRDHWEYGRWASATGLLTWIPGQVYYLVLPLWGGLAAAATLRAMMNLVMPIMHGYSALALLLTTVLARQPLSRFRSVLAWSLAGFAAGALIYWAALGVGHDFWVQLLYEGRYSELSPLLWLIGLIPVLGIGATVLAPALRALRRPDRVFSAYAASTAAALTIGLFLTVRCGPAGAAAGILISTGLVAMVLAWQLRRCIREAAAAEREPS